MATITDIGYELLAYIMFLMVQSTDAAENLARTITVCKAFNKFGDDKILLKSVVFSEERVTTHFQLFQKINGLLLKCAQAGNISARFLLAKVMLLSTSELLAIEGGPAQPIYISDGQTVIGPTNTRSKPKDDTPVGSFLLQFMPKQARAISTSSQSFVHYDLAKFFLSQCTIYHLPEMRAHLDNYIDYFSGAYDHNSGVLHQAVAQMCSIGARASYLRELGEIKQRVDDCVRVMRVVGMRAAERREDGSGERYRRYEALAEATMRCGATVMVLKTKCREAGVNFNEYFGSSVDSVTFNKYVEDAVERFEVYRDNAVLAFGLLLAFKSDEEE